MKVCPTCTSSVEETANFCPNCGHGFVQRSAAPDKGQVASEPLESQGNSTSPPAAPTERGEHESTRAIPETQSPPPPPPPAPVILHQPLPTEEDTDGEEGATAITPSNPPQEMPNFLRPEPVPEDEELTRVQPEPQDAPTERQDDYVLKRKADTRSPEAQEEFNLAAQTVPGRRSHRSHRKWLLLSIAAIVATAIALIVVIQESDKIKTSYSTPPPVPRAEEEEEVVAVPVSKTESEPTIEAESPKKSEAASAEVEAETPEPEPEPFMGEWILDVEARLKAPEFEDMPEAERNLFRSMMKKKNNQTSVSFSEKEMVWTETGTSSVFQLQNREQDGKKWTFSITNKAGQEKALSGTVMDDKMTLQDPFGSGTRQFIRGMK